jgi:GTPase SAR1 family protein
MSDLKRQIKIDSEKVPFVKIVIYGPGNSGKTSLLKIYSMLKSLVNPEEVVSKVTKIQNPIAETAFFDQTIFALGKKKVNVEDLKGNMQEIEVPLVKYGIYTVAGQDKYKETREIVVKGVDGVIILMDSHKSQIEANKKSVLELVNFLGLNNLKNTPIVILANKKDLSNDEKISNNEILEIFTEIGLIESTDEFKDRCFEISLLEARNDMLDLFKINDSSSLFTESGFLKEEVIPESVQKIVRIIKLLTSSTIRKYL